MPTVPCQERKQTTTFYGGDRTQYWDKMMNRDHVAEKPSTPPPPKVPPPITISLT